jgi:hypothetical protein
MAGPFSLNSNETQFQIPTNLFTSTKVTVTSPVNGSIEMRAGGSEPEVSAFGAGVTEFVRQFGGVFLAVKNNSPQPISIATE